LVSAFITGLIIAVSILKKDIARNSIKLITLFLLTSSPISIFVFLELFGRFVGQYDLKH
jgi:hypothetical protein